MTDKIKTEKVELPVSFEKAIKKIVTTPKSSVDEAIAKNKKAQKKPIKKK